MIICAPEYFRVLSSLSIKFGLDSGLESVSVTWNHEDPEKTPAAGRCTLDSMKINYKCVCVCVFMVIKGLIDVSLIVLGQKWSSIAQRNKIYGASDTQKILVETIHCSFCYFCGIC